ncbi:MAG: sigma-70 family RNA polymerase sigma factor, partial [Acidobacteria bacterium]|nr:sigma-70 family RNA polymerase sigma factor [Acidobacteriota bacterium]
GSFCPDVDDVVQETLARFISAARDNKIHNPESLGAFLSGICNNVILEYRRRLWRENVPELPVPSQTPVVPPEAEAFELREAIAEVLAQMSDRDCQVLRSFFLDEKDKDEICQETGLSDTQFRVTLFRAKERFRKIYSQRLKRSASGSH